MSDVYDINSRLNQMEIDKTNGYAYINSLPPHVANLSQTDFDKLKETLRLCHRHKIKYHEAYIEADQDLEALRDKNDLLNSQNDTAQETIWDLQNQIAQLQRQNDVLCAEQAAIGAELLNYHQGLPRSHGIVAQVMDCVSDYQQHLRMNEKNVPRVTELIAQKDELNKKIDTLKEEIHALKAGGQQPTPNIPPAGIIPPVTQCPLGQDCGKTREHLEHLTKTLKSEHNQNLRLTQEITTLKQDVINLTKKLDNSNVNRQSMPLRPRQ